MWQISSIAYLPHRYLFLSKTNIFYGRQKFEISVAASQQVAQRMENVMPIKTQSDLPAKEILEKENIFVMDESRATHQDIRVIEIGTLNLIRRLPRMGKCRGYSTGMIHHARYAPGKMYGFRHRKGSHPHGQIPESHGKNDAFLL